MGIIAFLIYKQFCHLSLSMWWILAAPFAFFIALFVPGGFTIGYFWFLHLGWITAYQPVLIGSIVLDAIEIIMIIYAIKDAFLG